ncbi:MAG TPA: pyrimidine 5'-nucleotidase [Anaerolineae bacterium]|nr:pyrimidine 5'-nucleotidase [Anaerolineae bacterium]
MKYTTIFFDIDNTLYPQDCGLWDTINERIHMFMYTRLHIPKDEITVIRNHCRQNYGTTLSGLLNKFDFNAEEYLKYIYNINLSKYLQPNKQMREMLLRYPQRKIIFTNANRNHALRVLSALELQDIFEHIISIHDFFPHNKFQRESFEIAFQIAGLPKSQKCVLVDDMTGVLDVAKDFGMFTIRISKNPPVEFNHVTIRDIKELPLVLDPD